MAPVPGLSRWTITLRDAVAQIIAAEKPEFCIHLAGISAIGAASAQKLEDAWAVNLHGTLNIADAIQAEAPHCRMIFTSSAECYGASFKSGQKLAETAVLAPMNLYAATKAAADLALGARTGQGLRLLAPEALQRYRARPERGFRGPVFRRPDRSHRGRSGAPGNCRRRAGIRARFSRRPGCLRGLCPVRRPGCRLPDHAILNIASGQAIKIATILEMLLSRTQASRSARTPPACALPKFQPQSATPRAPRNCYTGNRKSPWRKRSIASWILPGKKPANKPAAHARRLSPISS